MIRNAYIRKIEERVHRLGDEIEPLRKWAETTTGEARDLFVREAEGIRGKTETVRKRVREVRAAGSADWGRLKKGVEDALDNLKVAVDRAVRQYRKTGSDNR